MYSCANIMPPEGGPRDVEAPKLAEVIPDTNTTNYTQNQIVLTFNESVTTQNPEELIIQPLVKNYELNSKGKTITVTFNDSLQANTTYTVDFSNCVVDVTEKNVAKNLFVTFSTGDKIDAGNINGNINDLFTKKSLDEYTVGLYATSDSIYKQTPVYYTKSGKGGKYSFRNIKPGTYYLYCYEDKNKDKKLNIATEKLGFLNTSITCAGDTVMKNINVSRIPPESKLQEIKKYHSETSIETSNGIKEYKITGKVMFHELTQGKYNQLSLYHWNDSEEVIKISITDSLLTIIDTTITLSAKSSTKKAAKRSQVVNNYISDSCMIIHWSKPIQVTDTIYAVKKDSSMVVLKTSFDLNKLKLHTMPDTSWKEILIPYKKMRFYDSTVCDTTKIAITNFRNTDYTSVAGKIIDSINTNHIVQLLQNNTIKAEVYTNNKNFRFDNLAIADYTVRILIDENKNGKYDYADIDKLTMAERVYIHSSTLILKKNWVMEDTVINIPAVDK